MVLAVLVQLPKTVASSRVLGATGTREIQVITDDASKRSPLRHVSCSNIYVRTGNEEKHSPASHYHFQFLKLTVASSRAAATNDQPRPTCSKATRVALEWLGSAPSPTVTL